ncbi:cation:proton antiporter [Pseudopedobacter beijingensis]|uniref:Cation:proton antiporter n=1 Tax=Pseudopedobacter beijingensis TaxID=1207056 RepID=A0ABW4ICL4_9SPHI
MELYYSLSILIVLASIFSYLNIRYLKLPSSIGVMLIAMLSSVALVILGNTYPSLLNNFSELLRDLDFTQLLMGAMLNFLLFAGGVSINFSDLKEQKVPVMVFSTVSVVISTFAVGALLYYILPYFSVDLPLIYCLLFGALISPTDPVAVLGALKAAKVPKALETKVAGESLFNDGVAVVVFVVILQLANGSETEISFERISMLFLREAVGGILIGVLLGIAAARALKKIDDYKVSVLITLSVVMGGHLLARSLGISSPLTMVAAGLVLGTFGKYTDHMSALTKDYLEKFWDLTDEILNAILFLLIGFEILLIPSVLDFWVAGVITIVVVLLARFLSIYIPARTVPFKEKFDMATIKILVWGGLRGGVSIALALSINEGPYKQMIISITYFVVVFSILVQGLTIGKMAKRLLP